MFCGGKSFFVASLKELGESVDGFGITTVSRNAVPYFRYDESIEYSVDFFFCFVF